MVAGRDGAPLPAGTAAQLARLPGVDAATGVLPTQVFLLGKGLTGWDAPWPAAGLRRSGRGAHRRPGRPRRGPPRRPGHRRRRQPRGRGRGPPRGRRRRPCAARGHHARSRSTSPRSTTARRASATSCSTRRWPARTERHRERDPRGRRRAPRARWTATPRPTPACGSRRAPSTWATCARSATSGAWGVWMVIGLSALFAALSLVNTAAMATSERRDELATIRLLGGTARPGDPDGRARARAGGRRGARDRRRRSPRSPSWGCRRASAAIELVVPVAGAGGLVAGTVALALAAGLVTARIALRATPAAAMRVRE